MGFISERKRSPWQIQEAAKKSGKDAVVLVPTTPSLDAERKRALLMNEFSLEAAVRYGSMLPEPEANPDFCEVLGDEILHGTCVVRLGGLLAMPTRFTREPTANLELIAQQAQVLATLPMPDYIIIPKIDNEGVPWGEIRATLCRALEPVADHIIFAEK
jgi:hypothetical protein